MKSMIKKYSIVFFTLLLLISLLPLPNGFSANAFESSTYTEYTEDIGDGFTIESILIVEPSLSRASSKSASLVSTFKNNGVQIAKITLNADFVYDGSSSRATYASYKKELSTGWSYVNHSLTKYGSTAKLSALLKKSVINIPVDMKISCSPSGVITKN